MMWGVVALCIKQSGESWLSILKGDTEFLYTIHTFLTPRYKWCGELQLSVLNIREVPTFCYKRKQEVNQKLWIFPLIRSQLQKAFRYRLRGFEEAYSWKIRGKISHWTVPLRWEKKGLSHESKMGYKWNGGMEHHYEMILVLKTITYVWFLK